MLLLLGLTLTLSPSFVSAADIPNISTHNLQSSQQTTKTNYVSIPTIKSTGNAPIRHTKNIRVLIYNGTGSLNTSVNGIKKCLASVNKNHILTGYKFTYSTSSSITASILTNYDLLVMPGGTHNKKYYNYVSQSIVRNFVSTGHGYLGICAGAYSGSKSVYNGSNIKIITVAATVPGVSVGVLVEVGSLGTATPLVAAVGSFWAAVITGAMVGAASSFTTALTYGLLNKDDTDDMAKSILLNTFTGAFIGALIGALTNLAPKAITKAKTWVKEKIHTVSPNNLKFPGVGQPQEVKLCPLHQA